MYSVYQVEGAGGGGVLRGNGLEVFYDDGRRLRGEDWC